MIGRNVKVLWYIGTEPHSFTAVIDRVGADVASARGGIDVFARILDATALSDASGVSVLRPGAFVEVLVPDRVYAAAASIPEAALFGGDHVFVVVDGRLERRAAMPLAFDEGRLIVRGDFADGDIVLATRLVEAGEGLRVADPTPPDAAPTFPIASGADSAAPAAAHPPDTTPPRDDNTPRPPSDG